MLNDCFYNLISHETCNLHSLSIYKQPASEYKQKQSLRMLERDQSMLHM
jgi:hypothetical protein